MPEPYTGSGRDTGAAGSSTSDPLATIDAAGVNALDTVRAMMGGADQPHPP